MLSHRFSPAIGGGEKHVYLLGKELVERGHEVAVYTMNSLSDRDILSFNDIRSLFTSRNKKPGLAGAESVGGIKVKRFKPAFRLWSFIWIPGLFQELREKAKGFDLIHAHGYHLLLSLVACYYAKKNDKPFVLTAHDLDISPVLPFGAKVLKAIYDLTMGRFLLRNSAILIALTEDQIERYSRRGADTRKIRIIPNAIELGKYSGKRRHSPIPEYHFNQDDRILLFVGRIQQYKGVQDVIRIMPTILKEEPRAKFVIVGADWGSKEELERLSQKLGVSDKVIFTGPIAEESLLELFQTAEIFVFPSKVEGFGITLLEAMASETLCIAYAIPSVRRVIRHSESGILVKNQDEFLEKILHFLKSRKEKHQIEEKALAYVQNFSVNNVLNLIEEVYDEAIRV